MELSKFMDYVKKMDQSLQETSGGSVQISESMTVKMAKREIRFYVQTPVNTLVFVQGLTENPAKELANSIDKELSIILTLGVTCKKYLPKPNKITQIEWRPMRELNDDNVKDGTRLSIIRPNGLIEFRIYPIQENSIHNGIAWVKTSDIQIPTFNEEW